MNGHERCHPPIRHAPAEFLAVGFPLDAGVDLVGDTQSKPYEEVGKLWARKRAPVQNGGITLRVRSLGTGPQIKTRIVGRMIAWQNHVQRGGDGVVWGSPLFKRRVLPREPWPRLPKRRGCCEVCSALAEVDGDLAGQAAFGGLLVLRVHVLGGFPHCADHVVE